MTDQPPQPERGPEPAAETPKSPIGFAQPSPIPSSEVLDPATFSSSDAAQYLHDEIRDGESDRQRVDVDKSYQYGARFGGSIGIVDSQVGNAVSGVQNNYTYVYGALHTQERHVVADKVAPQEVNRIKHIFVESDAYKHVDHLLYAHHILIIVGETGSGKTTLARRLLIDRHTTVQQLDPSLGLEQLGSYAFEASQGYIIDALTSSTALQLSHFLLTSLAGKLRTQQSHLVIVLPADIQPHHVHHIPDYFHSWQDRPIAAVVLRKYLTWSLAAEETLRAKALALIAHPQVGHFLQQSPSLREVVRLAQLLQSVAEKRLAVDAAFEQLGRFAYEQVKEWFQRAGRQDAERTLMITLGVYNGTRRDLVLQASAILQQLLQSPSAPDTPPAPVQYFASTHDIFRAVCARERRVFEQLTVGTAEITIIEFENPGLQLAVLEYVWREYATLHVQLLHWLYELGRHPDEDMRGYAASATGWLGHIDFDTVVNHCIARWAEDGDWHVRESAVQALGVLCGNDSRAANVLALLRIWERTSSKLVLRLTAAATYGSLVGARYPTLALERLVLMTTTRTVNPQLLRQVIQSTYRLFQQGHAEPDHALKVLEALLIWTEPPGLPWTMFAGLVAFLWIAKYSRRATEDGKQYVPTLLWLACQPEHGQLRIRLLKLLRRTIHDSRTHRDVLRVALRRWLRAVHRNTTSTTQHNDELYALFSRLLCKLAQGDPYDRELLISWLDDRLEEMPDHANTIMRLRADLARDYQQKR